MPETCAKCLGASLLRDILQAPAHFLTVNSLILRRSKLPAPVFSTAQTHIPLSRMSYTEGSGQGLNPNDPELGGSNGAHLERIDTLSMDPAVFEKLFLNPPTEAKHGLRKMFGVPTPLALIGFNIALSPLAACLMGWRGSDQQAMGVANM